MTDNEAARHVGNALEVRDLGVTYPGPPLVHALNGLSLSVGSGECLGVLGEPGTGKWKRGPVMLGLGMLEEVGVCEGRR